MYLLLKTGDKEEGSKGFKHIAQSQPTQWTVMIGEQELGLGLPSTFNGVVLALADVNATTQLCAIIGYFRHK